jgi:diguanylate cyclase (GGDEF)-like protein
VFFNNLVKSGWLHALFIALIAYPLASILQKIVTSYTDVNILAYTGVFMLFSAITLLIIAGPGELVNDTLKRFETWAYSVLQIVSYILFLYSLKYVSATQGAALSMLGGAFIFIISVSFLKQKTNFSEVLGFFTICLGIFYIIYNADLDLQTKSILCLIIIARALFFALQKVITEVHKTNRKAHSFKTQVRVTGFIMAVASFIYLMFLVIIANIKKDYDIVFFQGFPDFADFFNLQMVFFAIFVGGFVVSTTKYCEFYASKSIGSKYLISITSLQLLCIYFIELLLSNFEIINKTIFDSSIIWPLVLILSGNFIISITGFFKDLKFIKLGKKQDTLANIDDNFIDLENEFNLVKLNLTNLYTLYDNNTKQLAKDINIDRVTLDNIINYDFDELKVHKKTGYKITNFASENVAVKDKLTKAYNRYYLDHQAALMFKKFEAFKLYYLDLNKFKPINDKYGHEAGDYVLFSAVASLQNLQEFTNNVFRVGGDEFVLLQTNDIEADLTNLIIQTIETPIIFNELKLQISTSVGTALSTDYETLEEMLKAADEQMFANKKSR